jgi:hypothetical protein
MPMDSTLRDAWVKAGYSSKMGSAEVDSPPIAHLIRVYHFTSAEYAVNNIALGRLKVARFSDLNDPFELLPVNLSDREIRRAAEEFKDKYNEHTGLLCFSRNWVSPVLWAQYGEKHRGVALGFNLSKAKAKAINYESKRLVKKEITADLEDVLVRTKFDHWSYEEEIRTLVALKLMNKEGALFFKPFGADLELAEVILGPRCALSLDAIRKLTSSLHPNVKTYCARLAIKQFSVVPKEKTVP